LVLIDVVASGVITTLAFVAQNMRDGNHKAGDITEYFDQALSLWTMLSPLFVGKSETIAVWDFFIPSTLLTSIWTALILISTRAGPVRLNSFPRTISGFLPGSLQNAVFAAS
jgi:hypothetical protein